MSLLGNFDKGRPPKPVGWNPDRSSDRFAYRISSVRRDTTALRNGLLLAAVLGIGVLGWLVFNKLTISSNKMEQELAAISAASLSAIPTAAPTISISPLLAAEAWAVVTSLEAPIFATPDNSGVPTQKLKRWTLLAFEKKSSNGWYRLFGGSGWVQAAQVKTYATEQSANDAIAQARSQATSLTPGPRS